MIKKLFVGLALIMAAGNVCIAQDEGQIDSISMLRIPKYEQMYKVKVWRSIYLAEKQNKGFFAKNNEMTKLILKAIQSGEITNFYEADLATKIPKDVFMGRLVAKAGNVFPVWEANRDYSQGEKFSYNGLNYEASDDATSKTPQKDQKLWRRTGKGKTPYEAWSADKTYKPTDKVVFEGVNYEAIGNVPVMNPATDKDHWTASLEGKMQSVNPSDISMLTLVENVIFDKRRSRLYYDMLAIELNAWAPLPGMDMAAPADRDPSNGSYKILGWIWYKDLEKVFRAPEHASEAVWFNRYNMAEKRNYADAFLLRLFHSTIQKVENPDNETIFEVYANNKRGYRESVYATEWEEMRLMEKEHNLWEY